MPNKEPAVALQKVNAETIQDFLSLIDKLAEYEQLAPPDEEAKERLRRDCLATNPRYQAYIGAVNGKPVAYFIYFFTYSSFLALPTLFLEDIFVLEEYRGHGVGSKIFAFIKEVAKQEGCGRIEFSVLKWNRSAQVFYERNGARCLEWFLYRLVREDF
ncbi:MAG: GNAT family N-acetyltransferase [Candidatus Bathyarchaeota archaeon]|nr:GNAT family N-acetyltransferase [Candidatus Bathyarchaeota archaeon]